MVNNTILNQKLHF